VDLTTENPDIKILGAAEFHKTGYGSTVGDFDGDTFPDLAVLSPDRAGEYYAAFLDILWGHTPHDSLIDLLSYSGAVSKIRAADGESGEFCYVTSGDFNDDGFDDIALGLPRIDPAPVMDGKVYIIFGRSSFPDTLDLADPDSIVTTVYGVPGSGGWLGHTMTAGDMNGDMYDDLIVSAHNSFPGGRVYVIHGRGSFPQSIYLETELSHITRIIDSYLKQGTGIGLASDDVDNDGSDDLLVGSPGNGTGFYQGTVTLLFGASVLPDTISLEDGMPGATRFYGQYTHGQLGWRVAIGDVNGDSSQDLVLSASVADPLGCIECGEIYVVYWNETLPDSIHMSSTSIPTTRLIGSGRLQLFGRETVCADVSGDDIDDIVLTSEPDLIDQSDVGKVTVVYGSPSLPDSVYLGTDSLVTRILGENRGDDFGRGLALGDLNGDGVHDILAGAFRADPLGRNGAGKAYLFYGNGTASGISGGHTPGFGSMKSYPNPFSARTVIEYELRTPSPVVVTIFNVLGQRVTEIRSSFQAIGRQTIAWDGTDDDGRRVASGIYLYRLQAGGFSQTRKMVILR
jgi:hypothetical protein